TGQPFPSSDSKRPVSVSAPMARFQPPLVDTNAQPSILTQFRIDQGKTKQTARTVIAAMRAPDSHDGRRLLMRSKSGAASKSDGRTKVAKRSDKPTRAIASGRGQKRR